MRILIAEDSPIIRMVLRKSLENLGHCVTCSEDGLEALSCWEQGEFDVVILDMFMPKLDGWEVACQIRHGDQSRSQVPILALSADSQLQNDPRVAKARLNGFLLKPYTSESLCSALASLGGS